MKNDIEIGYGDKLKGKLFGLLKEREKQGQWENFLETILIELKGLENELASIDYYTLVAKLSSLKFLRYSYFRKTIFECMNLIGGIYKNND